MKKTAKEKILERLLVAAVSTSRCNTSNQLQTSVQIDLFGRESGQMLILATTQFFARHAIVISIQRFHPAAREVKIRFFA